MVSILALLARIRLASATFVANTVVLKDTRSLLTSRGTVRSLVELGGWDSLRRHAGIFSPSDNTSRERDLTYSTTFRLSSTACLLKTVKFLFSGTFCFSQDTLISGFSVMVIRNSGASRRI
ncbi:hypothetical protein B0T26DRAFT_287883 [Lasiosphaeria miniovina]|uniref:Secreted protein n=1 Tax=Lasiosphaeria miniovina TaxID=1954250 RepID=A0AA40AJX4_9PEZI|nr:uncharacterized protein B0T26DRAFT_287883 [Lasiosphaeria miniovina]KAK0717193.1 hypothetical protein B0T26DRAFT_287883 [Lasiosphaeria miniovina]